MLIYPAQISDLHIPRKITTGQAEEFNHAANLLNRFRMPFYVIPGNHDDRDILRSTFGKQAVLLN